MLISRVELERWGKDKMMTQRELDLCFQATRLGLEKTVTTGTVAHIFGVSQGTVVKWTKLPENPLRYYTLPNSKDRRYLLSELKKFAEAHGIPLEL